MKPYAFVARPGTVYFVGAGPGAPDLITIRGRDIIAQADLILYADSLVAEELTHFSEKAGARILGSSGLHLDEIVALLVETAQRGGVVARVQSGDPTIYGAVHEQMVRLSDQNIPFEVVPGVTSTVAAAAKLRIELTVPDIVQTVILTRTADRTTMPPGERLSALASHGATLAIHLSVTRMKKVVTELLEGGVYTPDTPVAVVHKVSWPDESYVIGTLANIAQKVRTAGYTRQAIILVGPSLLPALEASVWRGSSHLYDRSFSHSFRRGEMD